MVDVTSLTPPSPGLRATLFPNKSFEPYSPKGECKNNNTISITAVNLKKRSFGNIASKVKKNF